MCCRCSSQESKCLASHYSLSLYGTQPVSYNFRSALDTLVEQVAADSTYDRYYNSMKEGYYQNQFSRRYGIFSQPKDSMVIIDKEAVVGYTNVDEKNKIFGVLQQEYKHLLDIVSIDNAARYGQNLRKKSIGNELDFLAVDSEGNIILIEFKHGYNTSGIYLSPLQIGLYYEIFSQWGKTSKP